MKYKRHKIAQLAFAFDYESKLIALRDEIVEKFYVLEPSLAFINYKPVKREVLVASDHDLPADTWLIKLSTENTIHS